MKLTLSSIDVKFIRRYKLDEPAVIERDDTSYLVSHFLTTTQTYEYGEDETTYSVYCRELRKDGTPKTGPAKELRLNAPAGPFADLLPDPRVPFLEALNNAVDE